MTIWIDMRMHGYIIANEGYFRWIEWIFMIEFEQQLEIFTFIESTLKAGYVDFPSIKKV